MSKYVLQTVSSVALLALTGATGVSAFDRVEQLAEDGVITRRIDIAPSSVAVPMTQVCESGAKWIRLRLGELTLAPYDSLTLVSSGGDRYTFTGDQWKRRNVSVKALRGDCVTLQPSFGNAASRVQIESYQYGAQDLAATSIVVAGAGDICDTDTAAPTRCKGTSDVIVGINPSAVFTAGDNAYGNGTLSEYNASYAPSWGRFKELTRPTPGNHDYYTAGAQGYFDYYNGSGVADGLAGNRNLGYYSWDAGDWHFVALNTMSGGTVSGTQLQWLDDDLKANTKPCVAAYWHHPLVSRGYYQDSNRDVIRPIWDKLYKYHADLVMVGHDHNYQRFGLMKPDQTADASNGIRQILVGTGGRGFYSMNGTHPLLEKSNADTHGVLKLTLTAQGYTGDFVRSTRAGNGNFTDTFSGVCHDKTVVVNQPPVASFSSVTNGLVASFTDSSSDADGSIASRSWNFGDGTTSPATNPSRTYAVAGTYTVSLTVTDNGGATHTQSKSVTVSGGTTSNVLQNGVAKTNQAATQGTSLIFTMVVPQGATNLKFVLSGGTGDADLYAKLGSEPTDTVYDCASFTPTNNETCTISGVAGGTYIVKVVAWDTFSGATLTGSFTPPTTVEPCVGTTASGTFSGANGQALYQPFYQSTVSGTHVACLTGPAGTNFNLYLDQWQNSAWVNVAKSEGATSTERVSYAGAAGYYIWRVVNTSGTGTYTITSQKP